jgi:hypothetical protein
MGSARVGKLREGPTAAIIAKPRAPSPPPLSQYPQLRPRSRDVGDKILYLSDTERMGRMKRK